MALLPLGEPKKCTKNGNGIIHRFTLCKYMALLPLEEPKQCTRDGYGILHSFALCKKYGTFALGRAKKMVQKTISLRELEKGTKIGS